MSCPLSNVASLDRPRPMALRLSGRRPTRKSADVAHIGLLALV
jgi:hypothetical protein